MTITTTPILVDYTADGVATDYALPFAFAASAHVKVYLDDIIQAAGYTITGAGNPSGGTLVFDVAPADDVAIHAVRQTPKTQEVEVINNASVFAETLEAGLDLQVLRDQETAYYAGATALEEVLELRDEVAGLAGQVSTDASQTAADRIQTGLDRIAAASSAAAAAADAAAITALVINGHQGFATKAAMDANLNFAAGTVAECYDPDPALAGIYIKSGASGSGSWGTRVYEFTAAALAARITELLRRFTVDDHLLRAPRIGVIGDSIQQDNWSGRSTADLIQTNARGELSALLVLNPTCEFTCWPDITKNANATLYFNGADQGVNGRRSDQVLAHVADLYAQAMDIAIVSDGVNDALQGIGTAASIMANRTATVRALTKRGVKVIMTTVRPVATSSIANPSAARTILDDLNTLTRAFAVAEPLVWLCDLNAVYDGSGGTIPLGTPIAGAYYDAVHPNDFGAWSYGAPALGLVLDQIVKLPPTAYPIIGLSNNLWPNPYFSTSGGTASTGFTPLGAGSAGVALNWRVLRVGSSPTGVASLVPNDDTGGNSQRIVVTPSGAGSTDAVAFQLSADVIDATALVGLWVRGYVRLSLSDWVGWRGVQFVISKNGGTTQMLGNAYRSADVLTARLPATGLDGILHIPVGPFQVGVGTTQLIPVVDFRLVSTAPGTGTIDIHEIALAIVPDPRR